VLTPTEVLRARREGARVVKLFPASAVGPAHLGHLTGPLPDVRFVPAGEVDLDHAGAWLRAGAPAVGVGGPLQGDAADGGDLAGLRPRARALVEAVRVTRDAGASRAEPDAG
jgi:2-dehydro-3-deoxyphosphogluconate aldolase/(4S)-4-hydroxy-2-oxoglutarate aldolase